MLAAQGCVQGGKRIQKGWDFPLTEDTYNLVKNDFRCESRGKVNVKGKGEINVWYVMDKLV